MEVLKGYQQKLLQIFRLPIPLFVIWSPNHISSDVPATNDITINAPVKNESSTNTPADLYDKYIPKLSTKASTKVNTFVYLFNFWRPASPSSLESLSSAGITIANNCITIEAVIYGLMLIANIENLEKAPPDIKSIRPVNPFWAPKASARAILSTPGTVM